MEPLNSSDRKIKKIVFGISALVAGVLICVLLVSLFTNTTKGDEDTAIVKLPVNTPAPSSEKESQPQEDVLQKKFNDLQNMHQLYNNSIAADTSKIVLDSLKKTVFQADEAFRASVDSVWIDAIAGKSTDNNQLKNVAVYRKSLDSLRSESKGDNMAKVNKDFVPDRETFIKLQDELMEKTNKIALLESSIQLMLKRNTAGQNNNAGSGNNQQVAEDNAVLENRVADLNNSNQRLQQEIDRLKKQPVEAPKNSNAEQVWVNKTAALQQKVNNINAELQLVRVDCNLSRVDATQIISNSKQRKQLLSEASSILTDLSSSNDADIKNKVKEKILKLNQVAANTRD